MQLKVGFSLPTGGEKLYGFSIFIRITFLRHSCYAAHAGYELVSILLPNKC